MKKLIGLFNSLLLPGFVFQNVIMAGGYGTGRELAEYFLVLGPKSALLAILVTGALWAIICALTFEFARCIQGYDYYTFFKSLLGRFWIVFEITYSVVVLLVLAIIGAASGSILSELLNIPYEAGVIALMSVIGIVVYFNNRIIALLLSYWSFFLLLIYISFFILCYWLFSSSIIDNYSSSVYKTGWIQQGLKYGSYNLCFMPAVLFSLTQIKTRKQALFAGGFAGFVAIVPAFFFLLAMCSAYPGIVSDVVPANTLIQKINFQSFGIAFYLGLFGTLVGTGVGMIHAINQRVSLWFHHRDREMPNWLRSVIGLVCFLLALGISEFGLVALIDKGYGAMVWVMFFIYVLPLIIIGSYKIIRSKSA